MKTSKVERRSYHVERRSALAGNTLTGYIAVYNSRSEDLGGYVEMLAPGCFDPIPDDVPALMNHNIDLCVARTSAGTLKLRSDGTGLAYSIDLPDTTTGRDLKVSVQRGDVSGCSFGFICRDDEWIAAEDTVLRMIRSVELIEVSVGVTFPAYTGTSSELRLLPDSMPVEIRSRIEARETNPAVDWIADTLLRLKLAEAL